MHPSEHRKPYGAEWPTILAIDDDPHVTEAIALRLQSYEVHVECASYGMHGYWLATNDQPDLIITDLSMPQGPGDYIVECLHRNSETRSIPVIVLTGRRDPGTQQQLRQLAVQAYFTKPVLFDDLLAAIGQFVSLRPRDLETVSLYT